MSTTTTGHGPGQETCRCVISPASLREVRRRRLLSLPAIASVTGSSREHLARIERGDPGACVRPEVIRTYEEAMGITVEAEVSVMVHDMLQSLVSAYEMLTRLHRMRDLSQW